MISCLKHCWMLPHYSTKHLLKRMQVHNNQQMYVPIHKGVCYTAIWNYAYMYAIYSNVLSHNICVTLLQTFCWNAWPKYSTHFTLVEFTLIICQHTFPSILKLYWSNIPLGLIFLWCGNGTEPIALMWLQGPPPKAMPSLCTLTSVQEEHYIVGKS